MSHIISFTQAGGDKQLIFNVGDCQGDKTVSFDTNDAWIGYSVNGNELTISVSSTNVNREGTLKVFLGGSQCNIHDILVSQSACQCGGLTFEFMSMFENSGAGVNTVIGTVTGDCPTSVYSFDNSSYSDKIYCTVRDKAGETNVKEFVLTQKINPLSPQDGIKTYKCDIKINGSESNCYTISITQGEDCSCNGAALMIKTFKKTFTSEAITNMMIGSGKTHCGYLEAVCKNNFETIIKNSHIETQTSRNADGSTNFYYYADIKQSTQSSTRSEGIKFNLYDNEGHLIEGDCLNTTTIEQTPRGILSCPCTHEVFPEDNYNWNATNSNGYYYENWFDRGDMNTYWTDSYRVPFSYGRQSYDDGEGTWVIFKDLPMPKGVPYEQVTSYTTSIYYWYDLTEHEFSSGEDRILAITLDGLEECSRYKIEFDENYFDVGLYRNPGSIYRETDKYTPGSGVIYTRQFESTYSDANDFLGLVIKPKTYAVDDKTDVYITKLTDVEVDGDNNVIMSYECGKKRRIIVNFTNKCGTGSCAFTNQGAGSYFRYGIDDTEDYYYSNNNMYPTGGTSFPTAKFKFEYGGGTRFVPVPLPTHARICNSCSCEGTHGWYSDNCIKLELASQSIESNDISIEIVNDEYEHYVNVYALESTYTDSVKTNVYTLRMWYPDENCNQMAYNCTYQLIVSQDPLPPCDCGVDFESLSKTDTSFCLSSIQQYKCYSRAEFVSITKYDGDGSYVGLQNNCLIFNPPSTQDTEYRLIVNTYNDRNELVCSNKQINITHYADSSYCSQRYDDNFCTLTVADLSTYDSGYGTLNIGTLKPIGTYNAACHYYVIVNHNDSISTLSYDPTNGGPMTLDIGTNPSDTETAMIVIDLSLMWSGGGEAKESNHKSLTILVSPNK